MRINTNTMAMNALRYTSAAESSQAKSMQKLSSGLAINSAADDAAGLAISEKMRAQINGLDQASENAQDGISMMQTAEGALEETTSMLQRMRELSVQASNSTLEAEDRAAIQSEITALSSEIGRIASDTEFNGQKLLDGSLSTTLDTGNTTLLEASVTGATLAIDISGAKEGTTFTFSSPTTTTDTTLSATIDGNVITQTLTIDAMANGDTQELNFDALGVKITLSGTATAAAADIEDNLTGKVIVTEAGKSDATFAIGANSGQTLDVSFGDMSASALSVDSLTVDTVANAQSAIDSIDAAITSVSTQRGEFGAVQNRLEYTINNLSTTSENLTAAESRIRDVDMAEEMMNYTKVGILQQASQAMLAQANQLPQGTLQLLQ